MHYYHVYNRGTDKRKIFKDAQDFERFLDALVIFNKTENIGVNLRELDISIRRIPGGSTSGNTFIGIEAYCLNPNHFHLLLSCESPSSLSKFMQRLGTGYSMYFNGKYHRSGRLFQGTYKKVPVESDGQLLHLFAYVNLNYYLHSILAPHYRSSLKEYFTEQHFVLTNKKQVLNNFSDFNAFNDFCLRHIKSTRQNRLVREKRKQYLE